MGYLQTFVASMTFLKDLCLGSLFFSPVASGHPEGDGPGVCSLGPD